MLQELLTLHTPLLLRHQMVVNRPQSLMWIKLFEMHRLHLILNITMHQLRYQIYLLDQMKLKPGLCPAQSSVRTV